MTGRSLAACLLTILAAPVLDLRTWIFAPGSSHLDLRTGGVTDDGLPADEAADE